MNIPTMRDVGAFITGRMCGAVAATAGGAGDNTELDGQWVDRDGFQSAKLVITYKTTLAEAATLSITANLQDASAADGTGAADFGSALAKTAVSTGGTGGTTNYGVVELDFDLTGAKRYIRSQFTPDLSAANTDTAIVSAVLVLGGAVENPVTARVN